MANIDIPKIVEDGGGAGGKPYPSVERKTMKYVALKLNNKTLNQKLDYTTALAAALVENAVTFTNPDPAPEALTNKVTAIKAKRGEITAAQTSLDTKKRELDELEGDLDGSLLLIRDYIQSASGGDESKISLLPVEIKNGPGRTAAPEQVLGLRLSIGDNAGEIKSAVKRTTGAQAYEYQYTTDPNKDEAWAYLDISTGIRATFTGLSSGTKLWVRARAVGGKKTGKGPWSDPALVTVP